MSSSRNTVIRSLHDLGGAAWFGGALMGAVGLNGAANDVKDPAERAGVSAAGWARWAPVNAAAIGAHLIGGAGLILANRRRVAGQAGTTANTVIKTGLTGLALASTAYSGVLGAKVRGLSPAPTEGGVIPGSGTPHDLATAQQQLRVLQWLTPALTGLIVILGAQQGEQQRPGEQGRGFGKKLHDRVG